MIDCMNEQDRIYREKFKKFAVKMVELKQFLNEQKHEYNMADQIQRSGTAIGAIHREATYAESDVDFIHKLAMSQKECNETLYWLELLYETHYLSKEQFDSLYTDAEEIMRMLSSSIITMRKKLNNKTKYK